MGCWWRLTGFVRFEPFPVCEDGEAEEEEEEETARQDTHGGWEDLGTERKSFDFLKLL